MGSYSPPVDVPSLITQLTLDEKIDLLAGKNFWETREIPRLGIPSLKVSDGPNGARGAETHKGTPAAAFPSCTSLAATFDTDLALGMGHALGEETLSKGAHVLLGPTVCLHRHPLGGRNFEAFSEDPFLAGRLAGLYIKGLQQRGVGASIKHFAANEQETERFNIDVNVSQKALREIYLKSFEIAIKEGQPWTVMTSYNLINGVHNDMSDFLLQKVLRQQWGFRGLTMSDWGGVNSVVESLKAGLTLEMPGPARIRKVDKVRTAIKEGALDESVVDARVTEILELLVTAGKFDNPVTNPEQAIDLPEHRALIREIGARGIVLLKNDDQALPLQISKRKKIALLGQSKECFAHGGGSASVNCHYKVTPWDALTSAVGDETEFLYSKGAHMFRSLPPIDTDIADLSGKRGVTLTRFVKSTGGLKVASKEWAPDTHYSAMIDQCDVLHIDCSFRPSVSGEHYLEFISTGPAKLFINEQEEMVVQDHLADQMAFILGGANGEVRQYHFEAGKEYKIHVETTTPSVRPDRFALLEGVIGVRLGFMLQEVYEEDLLEAAVEVAQAADTAIVFAGRTHAWETEGCDLDSMSLPARGSQDRLIEAVAKVNPNTIVVVSTGTPILMPWLSNVKAVLQTWFPGQEAGNSIADVLLGRVCPGGRLPCTFPIAEEASPAHGNFPGDLNSLKVDYKEGSFIGHRYFYHHPDKVLFPFGYGLSYTKFKVGDVRFVKDTANGANSYLASARVENVGEQTGTEVVQVYVMPAAGNGDQDTLSTLVQRKFVGFAKVELAPAQKKTVTVSWDAERFDEWDEGSDKWLLGKGRYVAEVATSASAEHVNGRGYFQVEADAWREP